MSAQLSSPDSPATLPSRRRRWARTALIVAAVLAILIVLALRLATQQLQQQIERSLGPRSEIASIRVGWSGLEATDVRIRSTREHKPGSWPADDELRARRIVVMPDLLGLLTADIRIRRVTIEGGYLSMLRTRDGKLRLLPALLEQAARADAKARTADHDAGLEITLSQVELQDSVIEFFDASVRQPALKVRLEQLDAGIGPLHLPRLDGSTDIDLHAVLKGVQRDGRIEIGGAINLASKDARIKADLRGVDLVALQPYLLKVSEAGVRRGAMDLRLQATVRDRHLRAPGHLGLSGLQLSTSGGMLGTFAGVPRQTVLTAMSKNERLDVDFTLEGRLDDPNFSLNENFATKVAAGLASTLGVSLGGVVEGVGSVIKGLFGR